MLIRITLPACLAALVACSGSADVAVPDGAAAPPASSPREPDASTPATEPGAPPSPAAEAESPSPEPSAADAARLEATPSGVGCRAQPIGTTRACGSIDIRNAGTGPSAPLVLRWHGADAAQFLFASDGCTATRLLPGATCRVAFMFAAVREGESSATLVVDGASPLRVLLVRSAYVPGVLATRADSFDVADRYLPDHGLNVAEHETLEVSNAGPGRILDFKAACEAGDCADFELFSAPDSIEAGTTSKVLFSFSPKARGVRSATIVLTGDGTSALRVSVRGRGLVGPMLECSPTSLDFGSAPVLNPRRPVLAYVERTIDVKNVGDKPFSTLFPRMQGANATAFSVRASTCNDVPALGTCQMTIGFLPRDAGPNRAQLRLVPSLGIDFTRLEVALEGVAIASP